MTVSGAPAGQLRTVSYATFANTVGSGLWSAGAALFLTRNVGLSVASVGAGLTVAGLVGLLASVPMGYLADRYDPRSLRALLQVCQAVVAAAYLAVGSFPAFLAVAVVDALLVAGNLSVRAALVAAVGGVQGRTHAFVMLRSVANAGIAISAGLAGLALAVDTRPAYVLLVVVNGASFLVSAALLMRLPRFPPAATTQAGQNWSRYCSRPAPRRSSSARRSAGSAGRASRRRATVSASASARPWWNSQTAYRPAAIEIPMASPVGAPTRMSPVGQSSWYSTGVDQPGSGGVRGVPGQTSVYTSTGRLPPATWMTIAVGEPAETPWHAAVTSSPSMPP